MSFPPDFVWGVATSAYQIEGAWNEDGRGESIWDRFCHTPGRIFEGHTGDVASDHYHRWHEDIALMQELGVDAYRFSVSWSRAIPTGRGAVNDAGLDFYDRLVDGLLEAGIAPMAALYHWDLPQALQDDGGWLNRSIADAFADYAAVLAERLGDRVRWWATLNEPWVMSHKGHETGEFAPGITDLAAALRAGHHQLLAHARALPALQATAGEAGIIVDGDLCMPASGSDIDAEAARRAHAARNRWYLDPLAGRAYPPEAVEDHGVPLDFIKDADLAEIATPIDFLGLNNYRRWVVRGPEERNDPIEVVPGPDFSDMGWEVYPASVAAMATWVAGEYDFPQLFISESGIAYNDGPNADGRVRDERRIAYLAAVLQGLEEAMDAGLPLRGYFVWSLLDNFEWSSGFAKRFGLIHVDFDTQHRTIKDSGYWYRDLISRS